MEICEPQTFHKTVLEISIIRGRKSGSGACQRQARTPFSVCGVDGGDMRMVRREIGPDKPRDADTAGEAVPRVGGE